MREHKLDRQDVDAEALRAELSAKLARSVAGLTMRPPGQTDADGEPLPGVLVLVDDEGAPLDVSATTVASVVKAHAPPTPESVLPLTDDEITQLRTLLSTSR